MRACWDPALRKLGLLGGEPEKGAEVLQRHRAGLFRCKLAQSGKVTRGLHHERRLVVLAAMRNRRQVGAVGLQKETLGRQWMRICNVAAAANSSCWRKTHC